MLAKLEEPLQKKFYSERLERYGEDTEITVGVYEINNWVTREFMSLENADFLEYDNDDETNPPTEEWNTSFEKKTIAYWNSIIDGYAARLTKEGQKIQPGNVVIIDGGDENYGYDNVKRIRSGILQHIREKGYMIASHDDFDGECKYYGDDERIPELLKQEKIVECITLGTAWRVDVDTEYFYVKGKGSSADPENDPVAREAKELSEKYHKLLDKMNDSALDELRKWCDEKKYRERKGELSSTEEDMFWAIIVSKCDRAVLQTFGATEYCDQEKAIGYVKNNFTEENRVMWQRSFINRFCKESTYNKLGHKVLMACFMEAYPKPFGEISKKFADQFEKKSEKIKKRLEELGYSVHGEKIKGGA